MALSEAASGAAADVSSLRKGRGHALKDISQTAVRGFTFLCALVSVVTTFSIVWILLSEAIGFFQTVSISEFFTGTVWQPVNEPPSFGVLPLISGTLLITVGAGIIAVPLGLLSAIFLSEYAHPKVRNFLKPTLELLAGIPTVVYGYFALFFVTPLLQGVIPNVQAFNAASGMIVVGIMILPLVSSLCEDALAAVPKALREGAYGLGATKMEVTTRIVVPAALSGVMAAFILALSRALGETMAVTLAAGAKPNLTWNPAESIQTMTAYIVAVTKGDAPAGTVRYNSIFAVGVTLFVFTMAMNLLAQRLVRKFRQVYQ
jgi:phosphate transport system permease protein